MGACASNQKGFPEGEKPTVVDTPPMAHARPQQSDAPGTPKVVTSVEPLVKDKYEVTEAPLADPSTTKAEDTKVTPEDPATGDIELHVQAVEAPLAVLSTTKAEDAKVTQEPAPEITKLDVKTAQAPLADSSTTKADDAKVSEELGPATINAKTVEAPLADPLTTKGEDVKVTEEPATGNVKLQVKTVEEADKKDTKVVGVEKASPAAEKQQNWFGFFS